MLSGMTPPPESSTAAVTSSEPELLTSKPAPEALPKSRHCRYCNKTFPPKRVDHWFCSARHRKQFHKDGTAYGKLKLTFARMLDKEKLNTIDQVNKLIAHREEEFRAEIRADIVKELSIMREMNKQMRAEILKYAQGLVKREMRRERRKAKRGRAAGDALAKYYSEPVHSVTSRSKPQRSKVKRSNSRS